MLLDEATSIVDKVPAVLTRLRRGAGEDISATEELRRFWKKLVLDSVDIFWLETVPDPFSMRSRLLQQRFMDRCKRDRVLVILQLPLPLLTKAAEVLKSLRSP